jgi:chromosome transmission fidelity protein 1
MAYLNANVAPNAGKIHYENLCMKAVNQSIGRAIRHKDDFAAILLLDHRYDQSNITQQLPSWIKSQVNTCDKFGPVMAKLTNFFKTHQN